MMRRRDACSWMWSLSALPCLIGCETPPVRAGSNSWLVDQPFHYPMAGVGGGAVLGSVEVPDRSEAAFASRALVLALQDLQHSVVHPVVGIDATIPTNTPWKTDIVALAPAVIEEHNRLSAPLTLRGAQFGVLYSGLHDTRERQMRYRVATQVFQRGAMSGQWAVLNDPQYSGQFFAERLRVRIVVRLKSGAAARA